MNNVLDLANLKTVPLHPDLQERLYNGALGRMISHPLLHEIFYRPEMNELYNKQYETKVKKLHEAYKARDWNQYVFWYEKPYRIFGFTIIEHCLSNPYYWSLLGKVWINSENIWQNLKLWKKMLSSERGYKRYFMPLENRRYFRDCLPELMTVYRGCVRGVNERGLSHTLLLSKAEWFSKRFIRPGQVSIVVTRHLTKDQVFAYLGDRHEDEIIIKPQYIRGFYGKES